MKVVVFLGITLALIIGTFQVSEARLEIRTPKQKERLAKASRVLVEVLALTDQGNVDPESLAGVVGRRLQEFGYTVVREYSDGYDVIFRVKCEQRKVWEGTLPSGGDADLPDSPSRTWSGPACQMKYFLGRKTFGWHKEVRTEFQNAIEAASKAKEEDAGAYALARLQDRLEAYDFPVLLTADWGQDQRLLKVLDDPDTTPQREKLIIQQLGQIFSQPAVPHIQKALNDPDLDIAKAAAEALGNIGHRESIAALIATMDAENPELKIAAIRGLGQVGALHGDLSIIPPLLEALNTDDIILKTEVVWALGKLPDGRAKEPIRAIQKSLRDVRTSDRSSKEGKLWDAVSYSLKQIDRADQIN